MFCSATGPTVRAREADLRLDKRDEAIDYGVIVPGAPEQSVLIDRITSDDPDERMPPKGDPLSAEQIAKLTAWIKDGAPYMRQHWSFKPPKAPTRNLPYATGHGPQANWTTSS